MGTASGKIQIPKAKSYEGYGNVISFSFVTKIVKVCSLYIYVYIGTVVFRWLLMCQEAERLVLFLKLLK